MKRKVALLNIFFCCSFLLSSCGTIGKGEYYPNNVFSLSSSESMASFVNGNGGSWIVSFDRPSKSDDGYVSAVVRLDNIYGADISVDFLQVDVYNRACTGKPFMVFEIGRSSNVGSVLPQHFSITSEACVEIRYFILEGDKLILTDNFELVFLK
ncbi:hypothetical protein [Microbulbifer aggregans]|uniref:hypothetical protein n=1 Tax=Microbulbifer aggregans TaxID=1769779 RepID=UPI001CFCA2B1|nr:hypothetical protein [Microbulbifer aggregans]